MGSAGVGRRALLHRLTGLALVGASSLRVAQHRASAQASPAFLPREAWHAAPAGVGMLEHAIERVTVHHTGPPPWYGVPPAPAYLRAVQSFHQGPERGWPDIAYHLLIDLDGQVWEGRPLAFAGDTATEYDPRGHALIAVLGDYDEQTPNPAQTAALGGAIRRLLDEFGLTPETIRGHRDYAATACPGHTLYQLIATIRESL